MTKEQLQKELQKIVRAGIKPSHLKKLKKSKSADDIANSEPIRAELENKISVLNLELEVKNREIDELTAENKELSKNPPNQLLTDQLTQKQKEIESLRKNLEETNAELTALKETHSSLLDDHLTLKHQSLKDWWQQYEKNKTLESELAQNIDEASEELINQDQVISDLRKENSQLKQTTQSLQKDLNLAHRLIELRKDYEPNNSPKLDYLKYVFYCLLAAYFISLLNTSWKKYHQHE